MAELTSASSYPSSSRNLLRLLTRLALFGAAPVAEACTYRPAVVTLAVNKSRYTCYNSGLYQTFRTSTSGSSVFFRPAALPPDLRLIFGGMQHLAEICSKNLYRSCQKTKGYAAMKIKASRSFFAAGRSVLGSTWAVRVNEEIMVSELNLPQTRVRTASYFWQNCGN